MSRGTRTIEIYRYDPDLDAAPRMQTYTIELLDSDRMLLDVLLRLKKEDETLTFRRSCREGICGSDGMNINGKNGLACLINMNTLPEKVTVRPLPGLPVVRDLVVDMNQFYEQYEKVHPYLINDQPAPPTERLLALLRLTLALLALIRGLFDAVGSSTIALSVSAAVSMLSTGFASDCLAAAFCDVRRLALVSACTSKARSSPAILSSTALINLWASVAPK